MEIRRIPVSRLNPAAYNPRRNLRPGDPAYEKLERSMQQFGCVEPIVWNQRTGNVVGGHQRLKVLIAAGETELDVSVVDLPLEEEKALNVALNKISGEWDEGALSKLLQELSETSVDELLTGFDPGELDRLLADLSASAEPDPGQGLQERAQAHDTLRGKFLLPPFTVLDARSGFWTNRKRAWKALGLRSELGRGADGDKCKRGLTFSLSSQPPSAYQAKNDYEARLGRTVSWEEFATRFPEQIIQGGTSIFDPVLSEVAYRWFCPPGGKVLDPFAGGSVRGVVAAMTVRCYTGVDLSQRQVEADRENWRLLAADLPETIPAPQWVQGDSTQLDTLVQGEYDLLFTCPPYGDLEVYSKQPEDLSNMPYADFLTAYRQIIQKAASMLRPDRFACIVVGEILDKDGGYRNFVGDTIAAFQDAGLTYYNEAVLITPYGSLVIRAGRPFVKSRKLGKTHQNVLVFVKGDPQKAAQAIGVPEFEAQDAGNDGLLEGLLGGIAG